MHAGACHRGTVKGRRHSMSQMWNLLKWKEFIIRGRRDGGMRAQWVPAYLSLPIARGGRGFGLMDTTTLLAVLNLFGMFPGYISFGWVADRFGGMRSFIGAL